MIWPKGNDHDILFIKDQAVYLHRNNLLYPGDIRILESQHIRGNFATGELPVIYAFNQSVFNYNHHEEEPAPLKQGGVKSSFLVFKNQKYTTVQTDQIAFFYIKKDVVCLVCLDGREYTLNQSLDSITNSVSEAQFYRLNRRYLINFKAIKEVEHYFNRKLFVKLVVESPDQLLINKEKTQTFLSWMGDR